MVCGGFTIKFKVIFCLLLLQWVGTSCADTERAMMEKYEADKVFSAAQERLRERDIEMRARQMATTLADQLFEEKAEALAATRAKEILISGPPPCECARNYSDNNAEGNLAA